LVVACLVFVMPALACGTSAHILPLPTTTLPPSVAPFTVATITGDSVQVRAGATGQLLWRRSFPKDQSAAGLVANGILYRSALGSPVTALRADDGSLLWQFGECVYDTISILGGILYATCGNDPVTNSASTGVALYALDARTGQVRWSAPGAYVRAVLAPNLIVAQMPFGLEGLRADSGAVLWTHTTTIQPGPSSSNTPLVVVAAHGLIAYSPDGGSVEALRASDGSLLWRTSVKTPYGTADWIVLAITGSVVVLHREEGGVVTLDRGSGTMRWEQIDAYSALQMGVAVSAERIIYAFSFSANANGLKLGAYNPDNGALLWPNRIHFDEGDQTNLLPCGTTLYTVFLQDSDTVEARRVTDGGLLWSYRVDTDILTVASALPVVGIGTADSVYLLNASDGKLVWKVPSSVFGDYSQPLQVLLISQAGQPLGCDQTS
jgi:outer membrane protein assembly factor BamB